MEKEIGAYEAKTKLLELLRRVEAGECFTITHRGQPVAELRPVSVASRAGVRQAVSLVVDSNIEALRLRQTKQMRHGSWTAMPHWHRGRPSAPPADSRGCSFRRFARHAGGAAAHRMRYRPARPNL